MVSVICPTSLCRHVFHPLLYECFCRQTYEPKELVVVDTGVKPSDFLEAQSSVDPRVIYRHYPVADFKQEMPPMEIGLDGLAEVQPPAWSLGLK
ncbi:unnamed protein product, partial [Polarella glacialis]